MDLLLTFMYGVQDSVSSSVNTIKLLKSNSELRNKVTQCLILNGVVFMLSLVVFEKVLVPVVLCLVPLETSSLIDVILTTLFRVLWVLPLYVISRLLNVFWYQEIADLVYMDLQRNSSSSRSESHRTSKMSLSTVLADVIYSVIVQCIFLLQAGLISTLPAIGNILHIAHMALVYALYAYEYVWMGQGLGVIQRTAIIHLNWCYFIGYGLIMSLGVAASSSYFVGVCVFSLLFPILLISSHFRQKNQFHGLRVPPLPLFKPSIVVTEWIIKCFSRTR